MAKLSVHCIFVNFLLYLFMFLCREEYDQDIPAIEELLVPLILKCKEKNRAMRIGTNHGSLSARVMSYWGDSPKGMVSQQTVFTLSYTINCALINLRLHIITSHDSLGGVGIRVR